MRISFWGQPLICIQWVFVIATSSLKTSWSIQKAILLNWQITAAQNNWLTVSLIFLTLLQGITEHQNLFSAVQNTTVQLTFGLSDASSQNLCSRCLSFQARVVLNKSLKLLKFWAHHQDTRSKPWTRITKNIGFHKSHRYLGTKFLSQALTMMPSDLLVIYLSMTQEKGRLPWKHFKIGGLTNSETKTLVFRSALVSPSHFSNSQSKKRTGVTNMERLKSWISCCRIGTKPNY